MKKAFLFCFLFLLGWTSLAENRRFFVNRFGLADGLASNHIQAIFLDDYGFLWIGGANGLQRFDGRKFRTYQISTSERKLTNPVYEILQDKNGKMWLKVGSDYGIYEPEKEIFTTIPFEKSEDRDQEESLWMDKKGNLFVILFNQKLLWIDRQKGVITDQNVPVRIPDGWRPKSIFEDAAGLYWVSCMEGIAVFDPKKGKIYTREDNPLKLEVLQNQELGFVINVFQDHRGVFWVNYWAPDEKLVSFDPNTKQWKDHKPEINLNNNNYKEAPGVLELPNKELWRYGTQTLATFDHKLNRFTPVVQSDIQFDKISKIIWDPSGGLWLATDQGLYFLHFDTPDILYHELETDGTNNELTSVEQIIFEGDTTFWLGSWGKGIKIYKPTMEELNSEWVRPKLSSPAEFRQVWDIHYDRIRGLVWVGLQKGNLQVIDLKAKKSIILQPEPFGGSTIRTIAQDEEGHIWFGTQNGSVIHYSGEGLDRDGFRRFRTFGGLIHKIMVSKDQKLWVATSREGVYVLDRKGEVLRHLDQNVLNTNRIERVIQLNDSIFLMGSDLLNKYNAFTGHNQIFSYSEGMLSNGIFHMEADARGLVWIYSPNGMTRFDALTNTFSSFGKNHFFSALPSDGHSGSYFSDGRLAFVSSNALLIFDPLQFERNLIPPIPAITSVELFGKYIGDGTVKDSQRIFSSQQNSISFDFNILNFPIQDRFTYYYRLEGADQIWIQATPDFKAIYNLLPPGDYQFEVKSANEIGVFSEAAIYPFEIQPSLIQTWWFKALLALLFLGIVALIYRMHFIRILAVVKLRSSLARDLHDDMGSTLSTINILSSMAKAKLGVDPAKSSEFISKISENSQRMMESMDDIVWSIKPENDSMERLTARMREFANQVLESKDIMFSMDIDERILAMKLSMDARRDLFLIFKEGINNAAKYSNASRVFISFGLDHSLFTMRICDYGKGFDFKNLDDGNGLDNMKKRALNINGDLEIKSEVGKGTELILKVQL